MLSLFRIDFAAEEFFWSVVIGLIVAVLSGRWQGQTPRLWRHVAERSTLAPLILAGLMLSTQAVVALRFGWPIPAIHDEFSYLLAADTFASGRATNPTHPGWEFFETYHVLCQPTYQSKYPPGSGLALAAGQVLTGQPIVGIWLCLAAATGGLYWMLRGWVASRWALLGSVILLVNWPVTKLSGQTYFGGAPALLGAILVYGALARLIRREDEAHSELRTKYRKTVDETISPPPGTPGGGVGGEGKSSGQEASNSPKAAQSPRSLDASRSAGASPSQVDLNTNLKVIRSNERPVANRSGLACRFNAILFGVGLAIWAITRPYEGLVASIVPGIILVCNGLRSRRLGQTLLPVLAVVAAGGVLLGWYHWRVTGDPFTMPYRVYDQTYTQRVSPFATVFSWTELGPRRRTIPSFETKTSADLIRISDTKPLIYLLWKTVRQWWFHVGLLWTTPLCVGCLAIVWQCLTGRWHARSFGWSLLAVTLVGVAILLERSAGMPHYAAPIQPLILLLIIHGLRRLWVVRISGVSIGKYLVTWLGWSSVLFFVLPLLTGSNTIRHRPWSLDRDRIQRELTGHPRPSLVIVKYQSGHSMHEEWVYNRADIDRAQVVWARHLGEHQVPELLRLFPHRDIWLVKPDSAPVVPVRYQMERP